MLSTWNNTAPTVDPSLQQRIKILASNKRKDSFAQLLDRRTTGRGSLASYPGPHGQLYILDSGQ